MGTRKGRYSLIELRRKAWEKGRLRWLEFSKQNTKEETLAQTALEIHREFPWSLQLNAD
jgi:hypothetical protein